MLEENSFSRKSDTEVVEFGAGTGHLGLLVATLRPDVSVVLVEVRRVGFAVAFLWCLLRRDRFFSFLFFMLQSLCVVCFFRSCSFSFKPLKSCLTIFPLLFAIVSMWFGSGLQETVRCVGGLPGSVLRCQTTNSDSERL